MVCSPHSFVSQIASLALLFIDPFSINISALDNDDLSLSLHLLGDESKAEQQEDQPSWADHVSGTFWNMVMMIGWWLWWHDDMMYDKLQRRGWWSWVWGNDYDDDDKIVILIFALKKGEDWIMKMFVKKQPFTMNMIFPSEQLQALMLRQTNLKSHKEPKT